MQKLLGFLSIFFSIFSLFHSNFPNKGLISYRESSLSFDPKSNNVQKKQKVAALVAHEQSHMWFGDLVTVEWWSNTFLKEGFATYFEYFGTAMVGEFYIDSQSIEFFY